MKNVDTRLTILNLLSKGDFGATNISIKLKLSNQIIHRHLKELLSDKFVIKKGESPLTVYSLNQKYKYTRVQDDFDFAKHNLLPIFLKKYSKLKFPKISGGKHDLDFMLQSSAVYSSNIEGVSIDLNSFINKDNLSRFSKKELAEVQDLVEAYDFAESNKLNEKNFLKSHKLLSKHILSVARQGNYRQEPVGVFGKEGLVYSGPEHFLIKNEMSQIFNIIEKLIANKMSEPEIIFWSAWLHLEIALVHPFLDGNGRSARLLEKWFMSQKSGKNIWFLQTENYYFENRQTYYKNLRKAENYWEVNINSFEEFIKMLFIFVKGLQS
ncbi:MAG TPA: Fic family protein [Candidatus Paceibacterota bacterium]|nr:Fic family protein [Candidatus Paceibacterota bacterium]